MLLLDDETPVSAVASVTSPGVVDFVVETVPRKATRFGGRRRCFMPAGMTTSHRRTTWPPCWRPTRAALDGAEMRKRFDEHGMQYGPAFAGLAAARTARTKTVGTLLAEVGLPGPIRSQQNAYGVHPALLDACFQSVAAHPDAQAAASGGLLLPLGVRRLRAYAPARNARYCYTRVTSADGGRVEADLDVLDEHGTVLLAVRGLQIGTGASESGNRDRVLNERLLTIEWQQRTLPEADRADPGAWLLISTSATADVVATRLTDALKAPWRRAARP